MTILKLDHWMHRPVWRKICGWRDHRIIYQCQKNVWPTLAKSWFHQFLHVSFNSPSRNLQCIAWVGKSSKQESIERFPSFFTWGFNRSNISLTWRFPEMGVSLKSSILAGFSIANHPAIGVPPFQKTSKSLVLTVNHHSSSPSLFTIGILHGILLLLSFLPNNGETISHH